MNTPVPSNETERVKALRDYAILDTPPDEAFDDLVKLAACICDAPIAAVSLVDSDRQWFKARLGIPVTQTDRHDAICAHGITVEEDLFTVTDTRTDSRFADLPVVQEQPHIQFYMGAKLVNPDGYALGMLCVMDQKPRELNQRQRDGLRILARQVVAQLELHRELRAHQHSCDLLENSQKELRASAALYHSLIEHMPLFILRKDTESRFTFANDLLCKALDVSIEELIGKTDFDFLPRETAARLYLNDQHVLATGETLEKVEQIGMADGSTMFVQLITSPLRDEEGNVNGVQVISQDVTKQHLLEEQLVQAREELEQRVQERTAELEQASQSLEAAESEASEWKDRYDLIVASSGLAIYDVDRITGEVVWSAGAERILGLPPETMNRIKQEWLALVHPQDRDTVMESIQAAIDTGLPFEVQYRLRHGDDYRWIQDRGLVVPNGHGRCARVLGMLQDITQRKLADDTIREQAKLLDQSQDAIMVRDLENHVLYWNHTAERMYGWTFGEALGKPVHDLLLHGQLQHVPKAGAIALEKGEWHGEVKIYAKNGKELTINSRWAVLRDHDGSPRAFLVTHTDLTEQKLLEAKFLRAQRLESIGALASGIAHDLNNVFTPILMSAQLLGDDLDKETRDNMLGVLSKSAQRGAEMVKQVLTFARGLETGRGLVQIKHLLSELENMMRDTFPPNITIQRVTPSDLWLVRGDATQLYQVFMNLCVNARDAMAEGGVLRLEASNVPTIGDGETPHPQICIDVSDTGSGMSAEVKKKVFEPFFTTKEAGKGTGLGLSTVMSLVKAHNGRVELESDPGKGARFKIFLPAEHSESFETAMITKPSQGGRGEMLLIVDDESAIREILKTTLEANNYEVLLAAEGAAAVRIYAEQRDRIDLVLTDVAMPAMDGNATIRALRAINPEVKLVAVTGLTEADKLEELAKTGVKLLHKPYAPDKLFGIIREVLDT